MHYKKLLKIFYFSLLCRLALLSRWKCSDFDHDELFAHFDLESYPSSATNAGVWSTQVSASLYVRSCRFQLVALIHICVYNFSFFMSLIPLYINFHNILPTHFHSCYLKSIDLLLHGSCQLFWMFSISAESPSNLWKVFYELCFLFDAIFWTPIRQTKRIRNSMAFPMIPSGQSFALGT